MAKGCVFEKDPGGSELQSKKKWMGRTTECVIIPRDKLEGGVCMTIDDPGSGTRGRDGQNWEVSA